MKRIHSITVAFSLLFATALPLAALTVPSRGFAETTAVRESILSTWLAGEIDQVRALKPIEVIDRFGYSFDVSQKKTAAGDEVGVTVVPRSRSGAQGMWVLTRRLSDGACVRISVYPVADANVRVDIRPDGTNPEKGRSRLDLVIYGAYAVRDVIVGVPFFSLYAVPFSNIVALTARTVPWELAGCDPSLYGDIESMILEIREKLPTLVYLEDGAFDENYRPILIESGLPQDPRKVLEAMPVGLTPGIVVGGVNCSGFAKWIVDGIIRPEAGQGTFIEPMKGRTDAPETEFTKPVRESRDLFFALDWVRNLASAAESLRVGKTVKPDGSGVNVTVDTFSGQTPFVKNVGYRVSELYPLLYALAIREPGNFYLGAISRERGNPPMRQYHHVVALFPRFDRDGLFSVTVFESAAETPCDGFIARDSDAFAYLVRIRAPEGAYFEP
jgi:hypothetical protein